MQTRIARIRPNKRPAFERHEAPVAEHTLIVHVNRPALGPSELILLNPAAVRRYFDRK